MDGDLSLADFADFTFEDCPLEVKIEQCEDQGSNLNESFQFSVHAPLRSVDAPCTSSSIEITHNVGKSKANLNISQIPPDSPETCLVINQSYQKCIIEHLNKLQIALRKNQEEQAKFEAEKFVKNQFTPKNNRRAPKYLRPINLFAYPYFRDARGMVPPDNEDTKIKRKNKDVDAYLTQARPFSASEYQKLLTAVKENIRTIMMEPHKSKRDFLKNKVKFKLLPKNEEESILDEITRHEDAIETIQNLAIDNYLRDYEDKIDWLTIAAAYMEGLRTADECECVWNNYLNPTISKEAFTSEEDANLSSIADTYDHHEWEGIARDLKTNRTAIQCFERYQSCLNQNILKKFWTKEEDDRLKSIVESLKVGNYIPWHKVVLYMDGRTRLQITNRWTRCATPDGRRGPFSVGEDAMLCAAAKKYGNSWRKMKQLIPGRSNYLCRERYLNMLSPGFVVGNWSPEEDRLLINLVRENNFTKWSKICLKFPNRTDNMCLQRAHRLKAFNPKWFIPNAAGEYEEVHTMGKYDDRICPSSTCHYLNRNRNKVRSAAEEKLILALRKVMNRDDIQSINDVDLSDATNKFMRDLQEELFKDNKPRERDDWQPRYGMPERKKMKTKERKKRKIKEDVIKICEDSSEDDIVLCSSDEESDNANDMIENDEERYYDDILDSLLKPEVILQPTRTIYKGILALTHRENAEYTYVKNSLYKTYNLSHRIVSKKKPEHMFNYLKTKEPFDDYELTIPRILQCFVLPPVESNQLPVFPANQVNLMAMEVFRSVRFSAIKSAAHIERSQNLFQILSTDVSSMNDVKCLYCLEKQCGIQDAVQSSSGMMEMRKGFEVLDDSLIKAIKYESDKRAKQMECNCDKVIDMRKRITLLRKRFASMFLWSWMLASTSPDDHQKTLSAKRSIPHDSNESQKKRKSECNTPLLEKYLTNGSEANGTNSNVEKSTKTELQKSRSSITRRRNSRLSSK